MPLYEPLVRFDPIYKDTKDRICTLGGYWTEGMPLYEPLVRFDPIYKDAKDRIRTLGGFSFFTSTMTQCKTQLDTFRGWAGASTSPSLHRNDDTRQ